MTGFTFEDERIRDPENPGAHSHATLRSTFEGMDPTEANAAKDQYAAIAKDWDDTVTVFAARIRRSSESAWDGPAAQAARQAISDYATDALDLTPALNALSSRVSEMVNAVLETKKNMPEYSDDPQSPLNPGDWFDGDHEGDLEREAQNLVRTSYTDAARITDKLIPSLPQPRDPVALGDVPPGEWKKGGGDGGGDGSGGGGNGGGDTGGGIGGDDNGGGDTGEEVQPGTEEQTEDETTEDSTTDDTTTPSSTDPTSTTPASTVPSSSTPSSTTPASSTSGLPGSGGGFPGAGGSGGSSGSSGLPGSGIPGAGRSLAGNPMVTGVPAAAGAGGSGAAGSGAGRSGMPMMGAPGAGRGNGGENESDRKTPDYLVNEENARELLGDEPRTIPGGVLGADIPAARPADGPPRN